MSNEPIDSASRRDLDIKLAAFAAKKKKLLNDLARLDDGGVAGLALGPQNQKELNKTQADIDECAADDETND